MKSRAREVGRLRVLVANEEPERLDLLAAALIGLGHTVLVRDVSLIPGPEEDDEPPPHAALVGRSSAARPPLDVLTHLAHVGSFPTVASLATPDADYVIQAARAGVYAYVVGTDARDIQAAIDIAVERFRQYRMLQEAFARRAVLEQAKGILMARYGVDQDEAFALLRSHAREKSRRVTDIAAALLESHRLLAPPTEETPASHSVRL
jgi:AmiR/NasT family two-component response regulator